MDTERSIQRFVEATNIPADQVKRMLQLADFQKRQAEHAHNGDPYPLIPRVEDKAARAARWWKKCAATQDMLAGIAEEYGFTVEYHGLWPSLKDSKGRFVEFPS